MPTGQEQLILATCDELAGHGHGFVLATEIAQRTGIGLGKVKDRLLGLDREGHVDLAPLDSGDVRVAVTSKGREELAKSELGSGTTIREPHGERPIKVVPKGLRSFDEGDKDFYLQLLPGPFRNGLPESIHFWKTRIEEKDPDKTFKVGVIIGPSGCGKTSLVKAGLLPRLADHVAVVYVEATSDDTEARLMKGLRKVCPDSSGDLRLAESIAFLTDGDSTTGRKVVLIIDQFEQWLHARRGETDAPLLDVLRRCDGEHVQAVLMVRDDFSMALHRFLKLIGVRLEEGTNFAFFDLFDLDHSKTVLLKYGQAFGKFPDNPDNLNEDQRTFLEKTVAGLAQDGRIVSVRLALFAEMVKGDPWTPSTLEAVGGTQGIGINFLEKSFGSSKSNPAHWKHQKAARLVLKTLLPEAGTSIKGNMKSHEALLKASGYGGRPEEFDDLLRVLDIELRLITPTDTEGLTEEDEQKVKSPEKKWYQLTHDYLIQSLRVWLTRKQRETRRGRAELLLAESSVVWNANRKKRYLPSFRGWFSILLFSLNSPRTELERKTLRAATKLHGGRLVAASLLLAIAASIGIYSFARIQFWDLMVARISSVPAIVERMKFVHFLIDPALIDIVKDRSKDSSTRLRASLALLPSDKGQLPFLTGWLIKAAPDELQVIKSALEPHKSLVKQDLEAFLLSAKHGDASILRSASALGAYYPGDSLWPQMSGRVAQAVVSVNPTEVGFWIDQLWGIRDKLIEPLEVVSRADDRSASERILATSFLTSFAGDRPGTLAFLLMEASPRQFEILFPTIRKNWQIPVKRQEILTTLKSMLERDPPPDRRGDEKDQLDWRKARAAVALLRLGVLEDDGTLGPDAMREARRLLGASLAHATDPSLRSYIINWLRPLGAEPSITSTMPRLIKEAGPLPPSGQRMKNEIELFDPKTSIRRASILIMGKFDLGSFPASEQGPLVTKLLEAYVDDADAGIHGAAEWTLRRWKKDREIGERTDRLKMANPKEDGHWFVNTEGQCFSVIDAPVTFKMGAPVTEPKSDPDETLHDEKSLKKRYAICNKEVSVKQFLRFVVQTQKYEKLLDPYQLGRYSPDREGEGPMISVSWSMAAAYCNWLSRQENRKECYIFSSEGKGEERIEVPDDVLQRDGYRLPTEVEWEYACRAGAVTSRYYGDSVDLLSSYAWYATNSGNNAASCGGLLPNDFGLFDMHGNAYEWCQDHLTHIEGQPWNINDRQSAGHIQPGLWMLNRGGGFYSVADYVRSADRNWNPPTERIVAFGFRVARTLPSLMSRL